MAADQFSKPQQLALFSDSSPASAVRQRRKASPETRAKMSASHKGRKNAPEHNESIRRARLGTKRTPETIEKMRVAATGKPMPEWFKEVLRKRFTGPTNPWFGKDTLHGPRTHWVNYNGIKLRSSYELRLAQQFDRRSMKWQYELKRFNLGSCTYLPDFFLPEFETYWEAKGYLDPKSQLKIKLFRELHPETPLIVATNRVIQLLEQSS